MGLIILRMPTVSRDTIMTIIMAIIDFLK